jgi:hypothetical protein
MSNSFSVVIDQFSEHDDLIVGIYANYDDAYDFVNESDDQFGRYVIEQGLSALLLTSKE